MRNKYGQPQYVIPESGTSAHMNFQYGQPQYVIPESGTSLVPAETKIWSDPIRVEVKGLCSLFAVTAHHAGTMHSDDYYGSEVQIRLQENGTVYVSVKAYDHVSCMKSTELGWDEFVAMIGLAAFGDDWNKGT